MACLSDKFAKNITYILVSVFLTSGGAFSSSNIEGCGGVEGIRVCCVLISCCCNTIVSKRAVGTHADSILFL